MEFLLCSLHLSIQKILLKHINNSNQLYKNKKLGCKAQLSCLPLRIIYKCLFEGLKSFWALVIDLMLAKAGKTITNKSNVRWTGCTAAQRWLCHSSRQVTWTCANVTRATFKRAGLKLCFEEGESYHSAVSAQPTVSNDLFSIMETDPFCVRHKTGMKAV